MSFASVGIAGQNVTITRATGSPLTVDYQQLLPVAPGQFGANVSGPYFNPGGVTPGEAASLGWDPNTRTPTLTRASSPATVGVDEDQAARQRARAGVTAHAVHLRYHPAPRR